MDELCAELALFDDPETRWWEFDDPIEPEQFDEDFSDFDEEDFK